jgi:sulfur carrier protein
MKIKLNGDGFELAEHASLYDLIQVLDLEGKRYALEVNEDIISRSEHQNYRLNEGDQVEIVQAIGGG